MRTPEAGEWIAAHSLFRGLNSAYDKSSRTSNVDLSVLEADALQVFSSTVEGDEERAEMTAFVGTITEGLRYAARVWRAFVRETRS